MCMESKSAWSRETAEAIIAANLGKPGAALPILHAIQAEFGFVPPEALPLIAAALNISRAEIHGVFTFYHDFRATPGGRHVLRLCRAEACQSAGAVALAAQARAWLGLDWGGTSADGAVTLEAVYCLGLCACAPAAMLDGRPVGRLNPARMDALLQESTQ
jgi:formate dehydrogenase subunit gamma